MEQEGELMLHYESGAARAAANLNQVIQWSEWAYVLLGPGQVEMCYWCITKRNAGKESSHISFYRDASWFSDSPDYVAFNEDFEGETSEDQKVVTDRWLQYLCLLLLLFNVFFFSPGPPTSLVDWHHQFGTNMSCMVPRWPLSLSLRERWCRSDTKLRFVCVSLSLVQPRLILQVI